MGSFRMNDDRECDTVSEAGDVGDQALQIKRVCDAGSTTFSFDRTVGNEVVHPLKEKEALESYGFMCRDLETVNNVSLVSPLPHELMSPILADALLKDTEETEQLLVLSPLFEYISSLSFLAVFGILGVLTRYSLKELFGPGVARVTSDHSSLYSDLPSNMVGSFLMGWWGVVFKADIAKKSNHLAIGLTTGYLGSLTTFSGWNQKMLDLCLNGQWVSSFVGFLLGLFLAAYSIKFGVGTAQLFKQIMNCLCKNSPLLNWRVNTVKRHCTLMTLLVTLLCTLWIISGALLRKELPNHSSLAELWLACLVAPAGVWIRWFLARLNGRGIGKSGILKWMPFGTLLANVCASCIMAALATLKKVAHNKDSETIYNGIQLGFLGALSTVSTFIAEYYAMEDSQKNWRAYVYALLTILLSFGLGILIFYLPVRTKEY